MKIWLAQKIRLRGYILESPHWDDSKEYPEHMFCDEIRKKKKKNIFLWYIRSV